MLECSCNEADVDAGMRCQPGFLLNTTRVTSPKELKPAFFACFDVFGPGDPFQRLLQASKSNFPSKMGDLDAYVSSYSIFCRFCRVLKVANPFLMIWDSFFMILKVYTRRPHPLQPISRPCSIEKYPSSQMANRYTRIFDAGGIVTDMHGSALLKALQDSVTV